MPVKGFKASRSGNYASPCVWTGRLRRQRCLVGKLEWMSYHMLN